MQKSMQLSLTLHNVRLIVKAVFLHFFPDMTNETREEKDLISIVDKAAQHTKTTSLGHYG